MKRLSLLVLACLFVLTVAGCGKNETTPTATQAPTPTEAATGEPTEAVTETPTPTPEPVDINVAVLKGPTAIGMVRLMSSSENGAAKNNYHFTVAGTADEITASIIKGDIPVAAVPCNLAATLYNKTKGGVTVCAVNTLGVLYILDTGDSVQTLADLKGKTIYATGAGTTPEYTLRHLLSKAGIDPDKDVTITFVSEASEAAAKIASSDEEVIAMLPQPYVTIAKSKKEGTRVAIDITAEWEKVTGETLVTGVIVANTAWLKENDAAFRTFLAEYKESTAFATEHVDEAAELVEHFDIFKAAIAKQAIPQCNIVCYTGTEMKKAVSDYLKVLFDANPKAVGGELPGDDFYYGE
ncbi:MAG: ABC transporter substrate-binding protein [Lachnospiraceae bacterium]|nr:ABC transporter substrate-binding protein [Lachnospiraceae bacterium]